MDERDRMYWLRNLAVIILWILLAWRVLDLTNTDGYDRDFLRWFALLAWLGGLITNELLRLIYDQARRIYFNFNARYIWNSDKKRFTRG